MALEKPKEFVARRESGNIGPKLASLLIVAKVLPVGLYYTKCGPLKTLKHLN